MAFKIWGKSEILSESDLINTLDGMGIDQLSTVIQEVIRKGCITIGRTKILALKFK